jgi:hypothetical protein
MDLHYRSEWQASGMQKRCGRPRERQALDLQTERKKGAR